MTNETFRPSLPKLDEDQSASIRALTARSADDDEFDRFDDRGAILQWAQRVSVLSLGNIGDRWAADLLGDTAMVSALLSTTARRDAFSNAPKTESLSTEQAAVTRDLLVDQVDDAYHTAIRQLAKIAGEYTDEKSANPVNPDVQKHIAMRPVLSELDDAHSQLLADGLAGFESRRDVRSWSRRLVRATDGLVDAEFGRVARYNPLWSRALLGGRETRETRTQLLAIRVFPFLNATIRRVVKKTNELAESTSQKGTPYA